MDATARELRWIVEGLELLHSEEVAAARRGEDGASLDTAEEIQMFAAPLSMALHRMENEPPPEDVAGPEVELRDPVAGNGMIAMVESARELVGRGHVTMAEGTLCDLRDELVAQRQAWDAVAKLLGPEPHVCTCDHTPGVPDCAGCSEGFSSRCRFEAALRTMAGL